MVTVTDANGCIITGNVALLYGYCNGFKTVTQSGYQSECGSNNATCYLNTNFTTSFPNGIVIGSGTRQVKFTSADAIRNFLPSNSAPKTLNQGILINPSSSVYDNGLAAQVVTTMLNVEFGKNADFASTEVSLGELFITSGTFEGMKVSQVLSIANTILGNGNSRYTATDVNNALIAINGNYEAGVDMEFLRCTGNANNVEPVLATELVSFIVYPNPIKDNANVEFILNYDSNVSIQLYNINGQLLNEVYKGNAFAGRKYQVDFNASGMKSGVYFLKFIGDSNVDTKSIIIGQ